MKFIYTTIFLTVSVLNLAHGQTEKKSFDFDWKFSLGDVADAKNPKFNDSNWQAIQLPSVI
jgi:beta-galactosidase